MKVVIVGGVAGGASAAARIRRLDEHAQIIMIERSGYVSYANCGLPYYVGGVIKEQDELTLQTPESFWGRFRIDVRIWCCWPSVLPRIRIWQKKPDSGLVFVAASLSTSGWKPPYRTSTLWAMP